jgi:hypothetical protein
MLMVISGIVVTPFAFATSLLAANSVLILRSGLFGRVSKDAPIVLMVRDGARAPPHHEA